jgi:hypothetical protein
MVKKRKEEHPLLGITLFFSLFSPSLIGNYCEKSEKKRIILNKGW